MSSFTFGDQPTTSYQPLPGGTQAQATPPNPSNSSFQTVGYQGLGYSPTNDPFGYTGGSLLTPWTQALPDMPQGGFGSGYADPGGFHYGDLSYNFAPASGASAVEKFNRDDFGGYQDFSYGGYDPAQQISAAMTKDPGGFKAPTLDETNDPGYAFRLKEGMRAIQNNASAQGARGGDVLKALSNYNQDYASSEYGNVWNRAFQTYNQDLANTLNVNNSNNQNALNAAQFNEQNRLNAYNANYTTQAGVYDRNRANAFDTYNMNFQNQLAATTANNNAQLQADQINSNAQQANNALGWQVASGSWDRNYQNALNSYNIDAQRAQAAASASRQSAMDSYNASMDQYRMAYDIFQNNQSNQFNRLATLAQMGQGSANQLGGYAGQYGTNYGNLATGLGAVQSQPSSLYSDLGGIAQTGLVLGSPMNPYSTSRAPSTRTT